MSEKKLVLKRIDAPRRLVPVGAGRAAPPPAAAPRVGESHSGPSFLFHVARRWWKIVLPTGILLGAAAAVVVVALFVPQYEAQALLEIADQPQYVAFEPRGGGERSKTYFLTQMQLIQSPWIMGRVVAQSAVAELPEIRTQPDPIVWLSKRVKVGPLGDSDAFTIAYTSGDPHAAALVVNEVATQYLEARRDTESKQNKDIVRVLRKEMDARHEAMAALRTQISAVAKRLAVKDLGLQAPDPSVNARQPLAELENRLITVQVDRALLKAKVDAMEEQIAAGAPPTDRGGAPSSGAAWLSENERAVRDMLVERAVAENPAVKWHLTRIAAMQTDLGMIESLAAKGSKSPDYLRKQTELRREEDTLVQLSARVREAAIKEAELTVFARRKEAEANNVFRRHDELEQLKCQLRGFQIAEDNLRNQYASLQKEMEKASGDSMELLFKRDELNQSQKVLDRIAERQSQLQTEQGAPARVIWHQEAIPPQAPVQDFPYRNASLALLIGLGLPFGLAVGWERYVRRIGDADCLQREASLAVLGETARLPTRALGRPSTGAAVRGSFTLFEESVDSLRTGLTLSSDMRDVRVLAVTSAVQNEGKTSVAAQLAISLARATGELVLLLDGDLRSPDLHRLFEVPLEPGLADVLAKRCSIEKAIVVDVGDRQVHLLPAGRPRTSPHRLLGNGSWSSLVQSIPSIYRYVIVDTPPVLAASESLVLARGADASLVCAMRDVSRADQVQKATERLVAAGSHVVGAVLNGVPTPIYARRYGEYPFASE